jgi:hypothetical protein
MAEFDHGYTCSSVRLPRDSATPHPPGRRDCRRALTGQARNQTQEIGGKDQGCSTNEELDGRELAQEPQQGSQDRQDGGLEKQLREGDGWRPMFRSLVRHAHVEQQAGVGRIKPRAVFES